MRQSVLIQVGICMIPVALFGGGRPVFHCSLDSVGSLSRPEVGEPAVVARDISFCEGTKGQALQVKQGGGCVGFPLPKGLPVERGAIEFHARIDNPRDWYRDAGDPTFFSVFDAATTNQMIMAFEINSNNGVAKSGWYFRMNHLGWITSLPGFNWRISYKTCFPNSDPKGWHHYLIQWNLAGLQGGRDLARVFVDGEQILAINGDFEHSHVDAEAVEKFRKAMSQPCMLFLAREFHEQGQNHCDYAIDELRIWQDENGDGLAAKPAAEKRVLKLSDGPEALAAKRLARAASAEERWFVGMPLSQESLPDASDATIEVSGLPPGVKFDAKRRCFVGIPSKGGIYDIIIRITRKGLTTTIRKRATVGNLPGWTSGVFAGGGKSGTVLFVIGDDGILAGRWKTVDNVWTMSAGGFSSYDEKAEKCRMKATYSCGSESRDIDLEITPEGVKCADFSAWACEWESNPEWEEVALRLDGKTCRVSEDGRAFKFEIRDKGAVDVTCTVEGKAYKSSALLIPVMDDKLEYRVFVCIPKDKDGFKGYCGEFIFDGENLGE